MTNADKVRKMTDRELVLTLFTDRVCPPGNDFFDCNKKGISCFDCRLQWLKEENNEDKEKENMQIFETSYVANLINKKRNEYFSKYEEFPRYVKLPYGMTTLLIKDKRLTVGMHTTFLGMQILETAHCQTYEDIEVF